MAESVVTLPPIIQDMKDFGFSPVDDSPLTPILPPWSKPLKEMVICHEDGSPRKEIMIQIVGKNLVELQKEIDAALKQGLEENSRDAFRIRMLEKTHLPKAYVCKVPREKFKELSDYITGVAQMGESGYKQISPSHPRTWAIGNGNPLGPTDIQTDYNAALEYWKNSGKFSEVVETSWDEVKKMR